MFWFPNLADPHLRIRATGPPLYRPGRQSRQYPGHAARLRKHARRVAAELEAIEGRAVRLTPAEVAACLRAQYRRHHPRKAD